MDRILMRLSLALVFECVIGLERQLRQHLDDPALTPLERPEAVRRLMGGRVNPRLNAALTAFQQALGRLGLEGHPRVHSPTAGHAEGIAASQRHPDAERIYEQMKADVPATEHDRRLAEGLGSEITEVEGLAGMSQENRARATS